MSSSSRKPYLTLKSSIAELFKAETRYLKASNQKESVFEKPYRDYEYRTMHLKIPKADWPTWYLPPWKARKWAFGQDLEGGALPTLGCPGCALYADGISNKCDKPVEIHSGIYCTNTPGASTDRLMSKKTTNYDHVGPFGPVKNPAHGSVVSGVAAGDTVLEIYAEKGAIKEISVGAWAYIGPSAAVWVNPKIPEHRICGRMIDGAGSICFACVDVTCLVCDCTNPPAPFAIDSYDSTIDPGGSAYVTVSGGCEPYSYTVSGTGYTASGTGTVGTITSASGVCGVAYASTAVVTVTDFCGTTKTCTIRNTGGGWELIALFGRTASCDDVTWCCGYSGNSCAVNGEEATVYHYGVGTGGSYTARWVMSRILDCGKNPAQGDCRDGSNANHTIGGGSSCGADTILGTEYGCGTSACCDCEGHLYYWTCGADCT